MLLAQRLKKCTGLARACFATEAKAPFVLRLPLLSPSFDGARVIRWHKKVGDELTEGTPLVSLDCRNIRPPDGVASEWTRMDLEIHEQCKVSTILEDVGTSGSEPLRVGAVLAVLAEAGDEQATQGRTFTKDALPEPSREPLWQALRVEGAPTDGCL